MKVKLHQIQCDEEEMFELPDNWVPVHIEHSAYATSSRKDYSLFVLERA